MEELTRLLLFCTHSDICSGLPSFTQFLSFRVGIEWGLLLHPPPLLRVDPVSVAREFSWGTHSGPPPTQTHQTHGHTCTNQHLEEKKREENKCRGWSQLVGANRLITHQVCLHLPTRQSRGESGGGHTCIHTLQSVFSYCVISNVALNTLDHNCVGVGEQTLGIFKFD